MNLRRKSQCFRRTFLSPETGCGVYTKAEERRRETHVSQGRKLLDPWHLCSSAGGGYSDRGYFSSRGTDVSGGVFADCVRLRLLQALERSLFYEYRSLEIAEGFAWDFAAAVSREELRINFGTCHNGAWPGIEYGKDDTAGKGRAS